MIKKIIVCILPWALKRKALNKWFKYEIDASARIGLAWIFPDMLILKSGAKIDHFSVAVHLDKIEIGEQSTIGRSNWITGFSSSQESKHFAHQPLRKSTLTMGKHSAITKHHHIDCTSPIIIGDFVTVAGYYSQILTHSIDIYECRQDSKPITIGNYCFIGTNCVLLGGSSLPDYSVLGAKSLLNKKFINKYSLYAGNPAKEVKEISKEAKYFQRKEGFVY